jgi:hypothetical protein
MRLRSIKVLIRFSQTTIVRTWNGEMIPCSIASANSRV